jgi:hypothetical protein
MGGLDDVIVDADDPWQLGLTHGHLLTVRQILL